MRQIAPPVECPKRGRLGVVPARFALPSTAEDLAILTNESTPLLTYARQISNFDRGLSLFLVVLSAPAARWYLAS